MTKSVQQTFIGYPITNTFRCDVHDISRGLAIKLQKIENEGKHKVTIKISIKKVK